MGFSLYVGFKINSFALKRMFPHKHCFLWTSKWSILFCSLQSYNKQRDHHMMKICSFCQRFYKILIYLLKWCYFHINISFVMYFILLINSWEGSFLMDIKFGSADGIFGILAGQVMQSIECFFANMFKYVHFLEVNFAHA